MSEIEAGSLGYIHLNKNVEVTYVHGNITSTIRDVLVRVTHHSLGTTLFFKNTTWPSGMMPFVAEDTGLVVGYHLMVTVNDD